MSDGKRDRMKTVSVFTERVKGKINIRICPGAE
jgi:hypothetical protein